MMIRTLLAVTLTLSAPAFAQDRADRVPMTIPPAAETKGISVQVTEGRRSMRGLSTTLRNARSAMHDGSTVEADLLRQLADRGDGLAALRYVRILQADPGASASDLAYYAALAVQTGRGYLLDEMLEAMDTLDPETEPQARINLYIAALYPQAWAGNALALDAVYRFNGQGRLFGALSDRTRDRLLDEMRQIGDGRGQLGIAISLMEARDEDRASPFEEEGRARALLTEAAASNHPGIIAAATTLLATLEADGRPTE